MSVWQPEKNFFRIGEVSKITGLKPHVLRYWETEFKRILRPLKSKSQQRIYQKKDIESILEIKRLLYEKKYTIAGAKKVLQQPDSEELSQPDSVEDFVKETLGLIKEELTNIKDILK